MATLKTHRRHHGRIRVLFTMFGYEVQLYGQTVFRSASQTEAEKLAYDLNLALG
jgi:hypothetical protein